MQNWTVNGRDFENRPVARIVEARTLEAARYKASRGQHAIPRIDSIALSRTQDAKALDRLRAVRAMQVLKFF